MPKLKDDLNTLAQILNDLNNGVALDDVEADLQALNDFANAHPELPLAGSVRLSLHTAAAAASATVAVDTSAPAVDAAPVADTSAPAEVPAVDTTNPLLASLDASGSSEATNN